MHPKLKISTFLLKRMERIKQQCSGCLFGVFYGESTLLLMGFNVESTIGHLNYEQIQYKFPAELDLCGLVKFGDCTDAEAHLNTILKDVDITDNPILLHCELGTLVGLKTSIFMHSKLQEVPYEVMESDQLYRDFCFTKVKCNLKLYTEQNAQNIRQEMHSLRKIVSGGSLAFHIEPANIYITNANTHCCSKDNLPNYVNNESIINDIIYSVTEAIKTSHSMDNVPILKKGDNEFALNKVFGALGCDFDILNINVLRSKTSDRPTIDTNSGNGIGIILPAMRMGVQRNVNKICIPLQMEAMAVVCKTTNVNRLYDILIESICRCLRLFEHALVERLKETEIAQIMIPRSYHFFPKELGHFLSCSYLDGVADDDNSMQERRKRLHRHFGLAVTRPFFRRANRCVFWNELKSETPLMNTHYGLRPSGVVGGTEYLVHGNYYYYHYLQQQVQDKGWGCAYRSLQTICSWFLLQGYTERTVPDHREIQQYLVDIGDKPQVFIGSSQWIGSTEVSMSLQGFLNIESKIEHVSSGSNLTTIATEIAMHFQTQGTPIMIGGGVLAHTIIGIDYCIQTGQIKFLILDPHYTGIDDLKTIQSKGWCGWKDIGFWDKKSYYNLCMPQRPVLF